LFRKPFGQLDGSLLDSRLDESFSDIWTTDLSWCAIATTNKNTIQWRETRTSILGFDERVHIGTQFVSEDNVKYIYIWVGFLGYLRITFIWS
jgi:hypothetical protein